MFLQNFVFAVIFAVLSATAIYSQENFGFNGKLRDENNGAIKGGTIEISQRDVRFVRETISDENGEFAFSNLAAGEYQITVMAKNFASSSQNIKIGENQETNFDFILKPEQVAAEVVVTSSYLAGTPESLSEIPGSIERITPQQLESARAFNFS